MQNHVQNSQMQISGAESCPKMGYICKVMILDTRFLKINFGHDSAPIPTFVAYFTFYLVPDDTDVSTAKSFKLGSCVEDVRNFASQVSSSHKEMHGLVSKIGRAIDKVQPEPLFLFN